MDTVILPGPDSLASHAADLVELEAAGASRLVLGLSGGSTPRRMHDELSGRTIDWSGITAWISDERWVLPDSDESNARMARESLTDRTGIVLLSPDTTLENPTTAATHFADVILPVMEGGKSRSIVFLGLGTDGHTASLFPGTAALSASGPSYVANYVPQMDTWRLTATYDLIGLADIVVFLVSGDSKAPIVREIMDGADHPAARVTAMDRVVWLLDEAAAAGLGQDHRS